MPRKITGPAFALFTISILLPATLLVLVSWQSRYQVLDAARGRAERTISLLQEHALKVFETHQLAVGQIQERVRSMTWERFGDDQITHDMLRGLQNKLKQISTITVTDAAGGTRASSRSFPAPVGLQFNDRDWFQALSTGRLDQLYVSRSYLGRQSGQAVFNVADRIESGSGELLGVIAVSVNRSYFERFYSQIEKGLDHSVILARRDGEILASYPPSASQKLAAASPFWLAIGQGERTQIDAIMEVDGGARLFGAARVGMYPVYVGYGISSDAALAGWRRNLVLNAIVAALSSLALLIISGIALTHLKRERKASLKWQEAADEAVRQSQERQRAEEHLRQSQKMEAVGQLTGGIAHDFNNMLAVIISGLSMAQKRMARGDTNIKPLIDAAMDGATRASTLTGRLMAFARQQPLSPQAIQPNRLVDGLTDMITRAIGEAIRIETVLAADIWTVKADPGQLESAILNICVNARDAMPGGGKLIIETTNAEIDPASGGEHGLQPGQYVLLAITDTGHGMLPDVITRAFEPFFTTKEIGKGTGLGLSQVHGFIKQSDGYLSICSELDIGTTIKIYLPRHRGVVQVNSARKGGENEAAEALLGSIGKVVLVVEDDERVRALTLAAVRELGYAALEANGATQALAILAGDQDVDLLFTDVIMPEVNGRQLATKAITARPGLKVLFTTGYSRNAIVHNGVLDADIQLLSKPYTLQQLAEKLTEIISND